MQLPDDLVRLVSMPRICNNRIVVHFILSQLGKNPRIIKKNIYIIKKIYI